VDATCSCAERFGSESRGAPVSIDTYKSQTALRALSLGVCVVNDIWGLQYDPDMADVIASSQAGVVVMHNRQSTDPELDIVSDMLLFFEKSLDIAKRAGIPESRIALDPGIGFGKTRQQNYQALHANSKISNAGISVVNWVSRKSIFKNIPDSLVEGRLLGTLR